MRLEIQSLDQKPLVIDKREVLDHIAIKKEGQLDLRIKIDQAVEMAEFILKAAHHYHKPTPRGDHSRQVTLGNAQTIEIRREGSPNDPKPYSIIFKEPDDIDYPDLRVSSPDFLRIIRAIKITLNQNPHYRKRWPSDDGEKQFCVGHVNPKPENQDRQIWISFFPWGLLGERARADLTKPEAYELIDAMETFLDKKTREIIPDNYDTEKTRLFHTNLKAPKDLIYKPTRSRRARKFKK